MGLEPGARYMDSKRVIDTGKPGFEGAESSTDCSLELESSDVIDSVDLEVNHPRSDYVASPKITHNLR